MWTENEKIRVAIRNARASGVTARHRISVPDFERLLGSDEESKEKPISAYRRVSHDVALKDVVQKLISDLLESEQHEPFDGSLMPPGEAYLDSLERQVLSWAVANGEADDIRYRGKQN